MFDIGFTELLLVGIVALLVLGPERLPEAIRSTSRLLHRLRASFNSLQRELDRACPEARVLVHHLEKCLP